MTTPSARLSAVPDERSEVSGTIAIAAVAKPRRRALILLPLLTMLAGGALTTHVLLGRGKQTTDDAQVEAHVANVSARVSGQVLRVHVRDNQRVNAGDLLVELDARDLTARRAAARADLAAAQAQLRASETQLDVTRNEVNSNLEVARGGLAQAAAVSGTTQAAIETARADVAAAEAQRALASNEQSRSEALFTSGALSQALYDARKTSLEQADAVVNQAKARLSSALANLGNSAGTMQTARGRYIAAQSAPERVEAAAAQVELARARVDQARAALDQAELNVSYTQLRAQVSGVVSRRSVEIGQQVSPERPLLALVDLDDTWVVANFKEDQIAELRPGQPVRVSIDSYPGRELAGHVDSLASGTGARFSLLPPDNASGNFTKVVQRVPVLIRLAPHPDVELRPGMSAFASVSTK